MKYKSYLFFISILLFACSDQTPTTNHTKSRGFTIFLWNSRNQFIANNFAASVNKIKKMGANTILLSPYLFVDNSQDSSPRPGTETISASSLSNAIWIIKTNGLQSGLKPHVNCLDGTARWNWNPTNRVSALSNYNFFFTQYAILAQKMSMEYFFVGTELDQIAKDAVFFPYIIQNIRATYSGKISYASSYNHFANINFWDKCDYIGVNSWFFLSDEKTPSIETVLYRWGEWNSLLNYYAAYYNKKIFITEIGFIDTDYCAKNPGDYTTKSSQNELAQANCYHASLINFALQENFEGLSIWNWELNIGSSKIIDFTPENKLAETEIKKLWTQQ